MVLYDDKKWLSRLIRTAFTIEDDSGICEKVLKQKPYLGEGVEPDSSDSAESIESFEIREGSDIGHRRRSNTAVRLEKLDEQRKKQKEAQLVTVRFNPDEVGRNPMTFTRDETYKERVKKLAGTNVFSAKQLIESVSNPDTIPYAQYARFEASCQPAAPSKRIAIFLGFLEPAKRAYPLDVVVTGSARVIDLIGLILWMATQHYPGIELFPVHQYNLQIGDEDGEWDTDFPPLDHSEPIIKFSFSHLALVRNERTPRTPQQQVPQNALAFLLPNRSMFRLNVEDAEMSIGHLVTLVLNKSGWSHSVIPPGSITMGYHFEKLGDPKTKFMDMGMPLRQCNCRDFCLVRNGAKSAQETSTPTDASASSTRNPVELAVGRTYLYQVMVSTGRFNKLKNALCEIWSGDRMDLEFQHKKKSYPLSIINGVKFDATRNRIVLSLVQPPSTGVVGSHLTMTTSTQLTFTTAEARTANELYQHFNLILTSRK